VIESANGAGIRLKQSDVARLEDEDRRYFLVKDCFEPVHIPVSPG
jgi:hypothetical protein